MASVLYNPDNIPHVEPEQIYFGSYESDKPKLALRIATGGAGQSGLVGALANAFIDYQVKTKDKPTNGKPFSVGWLKSDTAGSFNYLAQGSADLSITYHKGAEDIAKDQDVWDKRVYAWRDHFMVVGPKANPAKLDTDSKDIKELFKKLFRGAIETNNDVRFLSRFDKSATNIKESSIWNAIGLVPWAFPYSFFYHVMTVFPFQALEAASRLGEYHLTDWGTWNGVEQWVRDSMTVYYVAKDDDGRPEMLNPARLLVGTHGNNKDLADAFAVWMAKDDGGQEIVSKFTLKNGVVPYTRAPKDESEG